MSFSLIILITTFQFNLTHISNEENCIHWTNTIIFFRDSRISKHRSGFKNDFILVKFNPKIHEFLWLNTHEILDQNRYRTVLREKLDILYNSTTIHRQWKFVHMVEPYKITSPIIKRVFSLPKIFRSFEIACKPIDWLFKHHYCVFFLISDSN